ncbi:type II toxin-antitoxin system ParD family antitoxin [Zavarzinia aquatilis]|uniref:Type II toxin-antitoxin system ParD family antitoxin n=1 Tax=Zavarzinia aquatilis TaxID=2211142 RepID=A0A317DW40_9PROT|nr:type II toxin-antitoxin system ParD family antitoxin [Zavarzinia aquatilis]PWR18612.1 type II toxin-antitoxin system ParD family antitoxin [Zavarzinia aquatilis]
MPSSYTIGKHFEDFIREQVATGRYASASEVIRDALRLLEEREARKAAFEKAIEDSLADVEAGRVIDADEVFDRLLAQLEALPAGTEGA